MNDPRYVRRSSVTLKDPDGAADERFETAEARARNRESVDRHIESLIAKMPAEKVVQLLSEPESTVLLPGLRLGRGR